MRQTENRIEELKITSDMGSIFRLSVCEESSENSEQVVLLPINKPFFFSVGRRMKG